MSTLVGGKNRFFEVKPDQIHASNGWVTRKT